MPRDRGTVINEETRMADTRNPGVCGQDAPVMDACLGRGSALAARGR